MSRSPKTRSVLRPRPQERRHPWLPYLTVAAALLGAGVGALMPSNPVLWNVASGLFPRTNDNQVRVVAIDQTSLGDYGPTETWSRELYGTAVAQLQAAGAKVVGLDVVFEAPKAEDPELNAVFSSPNVVLATAPGQVGLASTQSGWAAPRGVSALRIGPAGQLNLYQTGYRSESGELIPSLAWQMAKAAGHEVPLDDRPRFLHQFSPPFAEQSLSFRDVVQGNFRYADVQGRTVLIGLADPAAESGGWQPTEDGVALQAQAVASLLSPDMVRFGPWAVMLLAALVSALTVLFNRYWGFIFAVAAIPLTLLLWKAGVMFPGLTLGFASLIGLLAVAAENLLTRRSPLGTHPGLAMLGNRASLTRALEQLLMAERQQAAQAQQAGPAGDPAPAAAHTALFTVYLAGYQELLSRFGQAEAEQALGEGMVRLHQLDDPANLGLNGMAFRWRPDEVALLIDGADERQASLDAIREEMMVQLGSVRVRGLGLDPHIGVARTGQVCADTDECVLEMIERARRDGLERSRS